MRKQVLFIIIATFMLCACAKENNTVAEDVSVEEGSTANIEDVASEEGLETSITSTKNLSEYTSYDEFIEDIKRIMDIYEKSPDYDLFSDRVELKDWFTYSMITSIEYAADEFGYIREDIDGDGGDELLLGTTGAEEKSEDSDITHMYTIKEGKIVPVFESEYREYYQLCEDGVVAYYFNFPPMPFGVEYYKYNAGNLEFMEGIHYEFEFADDEFHDHYCYSDNAPYVPYTVSQNNREITEKEYDKLSEELEHKYNKPKFQLHLFKEE